MLLRVHGLHVVLVLSSSLVFWSTGCRRESDHEQAGSSGAPSLSVAETFEQLRVLHERRAYGGMRAYMPADQGEPVVDLLMAIDRLLAGNEAALAAIREACPSFPVERYDLSPITDRLGLFSRNLRLVEVKENGAQATVAVQNGEQLPLEYLEFIRQADRWLYQPGPPGPRVVPILSEMTDALNRLARSVAEKPMNQEDIENEYRLNVRPRLRRIRELFEAREKETTTTPAGAKDTP